MNVSFIDILLVIPVTGGTVFSLLCVVAAFRFMQQMAADRKPETPALPPVSLLKPLCGIEKNHRETLRSACLQDYPDYQVIFSVQDPRDPVIPLLHELRDEFGDQLVTVVVKNIILGPNPKINNLAGALTETKHEIIVISDSDVKLGKDYLRKIVPPVAEDLTGCACTLYRAVGADRWVEKLELLSMNADFTPSLLFAQTTGASDFCIGASLAVKKSSLDAIGGLKGLADYLVEDYEIGRRFRSSGKKVAIVPYFVEIVIDYPGFSRWWKHQIYWDQNTRFARPAGFFASILVRAVPFALLFAAWRFFDPTGTAVFAGACIARILTSAIIMRLVLKDTEGLKCLHLLPLRDVLGLVSWGLSFMSRTVTWRGTDFSLTKDGRLIARQTDGSEKKS